MRAELLKSKRKGTLFSVIYFHLLPGRKCLQGKACRRFSWSLLILAISGKMTNFAIFGDFLSSENIK